MSEKGEAEVETRFSGDDSPLQAAIGRILGGAKRVNAAFDHASEMLGKVASVAAVVGGGLSLERALESTKEYLSSIDRISRLTGESTADTDGLLEAMEKVGIEGEMSERIFLGISRKTATAEQHMNAMGQATGSTGDMMRRLGVNLQKGPVSALEQMSRQVQRGKLGAAELGVAFGVPRTQVVGLMELLQRGPGYIRESVEEARKFGVTVDDLAAFKRMQGAQREIGAAWKRISVIVGSELMPIVADLLKGGAEKLKGWVEHAREFGKTMGGFLREHYQMVIRIGKVMLANYALQRATGSGFGGHLFGFRGEGGGREGGESEGAAGRSPLALLPRLLGFIIGRGRGERDEHGRFTGETSGPLGMLIKRVLGAPGLLAMRLAGPGKATEGIAGVANKVFGIFARILPVVARLSIIGVVAGIAYGAFYAIKHNVMGIHKYATDLWHRLTIQFKAIGIALAPLFHAFGPSGTIGSFFGRVVVGIFHGLGYVAEKLLQTVHMIINVFKAVGEMGIRAAFKDPTKVLTRAWEMTMRDTAQAYVRDFQAQNRAAAAKRQAPKERERQPYFDFRGSRFDIKQSFSEIDADRIALGFANSLGALGERRVQSSFAPLWSV